MFRVFYCLQHQHDGKLVVLTVAVCLMSVAVAVLTFNRARLVMGTARLRWVVTCGAATGFGVWASHFIAMLAYDPGVPLAFDLRLTLLSLIAAMAITAGGIHVVLAGPGRLARIAGGAVVGSGICTMHYLGMMALDLPGRLVWDPGLVAVSFIVGIALSAAAMQALGDRETRLGNGVAGTCLALAILGHHFIAMGAVTLVPDPAEGLHGLVLSPAAMSVTIAMTALVVLGLCIHAVIWGRKLDEVRAAGDRRLRILLEGVTDYAIFMLDPEGRVTDWSAGAEHIKGYSASDAVGHSFAEISGMDDRAARRHAMGLETALRDGRYEVEFTGRRKDGGSYRGHAVITAVHDDHGRHLGFAHITQDITARKADQERVEEVSRHLDAALTHMSHGLCVYDRNERLILANKRFGEIYGYDPEALRPGVTFRELAALALEKRDGKAPDEDMVEHIHGRARALFSRPGGGDLVSTDFAGRTIAISHRPMPEGGWVSTFEDITERATSEARIAHMARHDGLTGLANRLHFNDCLDRELERALRHGEKLAVITLDMDHFKAVNDLRGHAIGDEALKGLAARLRDLTAGDGRAIARFGADEFAVVRRFADRESLDTGLQALQHGLSRPLPVPGGDVALTASLGVALYPNDGRAREALLNNADLALHRAKGSLTGKVCYFDAATDEAARDRRALAKDLETALERHEFRLFYQVQQCVATRRITGYEALIRWRHPVRGLVSPADFIPLAEDSGAIIAIGDWVLRTACAAAAVWDTDVKIAVNLSPLQLCDVNLIETVRAVLLETGLAPRRLELEITESTIIADKQRALHILRQIKALGVTIAIDDFGTGYASLDTLGAFPFDKIKIDRSFLMEAAASKQARAIIRAILALGKSLEIPVLAEGVETEQQMTLLGEEGCDEAQGFLLGRPAEFIDAAGIKAAG